MFRKSELLQFSSTVFNYLLLPSFIISRTKKITTQNYPEKASANPIASFFDSINREKRCSG